MALTGAVERVGTSTNFGVGETGPNGIAFHNGTLYMVGVLNDALYTLNTTTGMATRVGSATIFGDIFENAPSGLASHSGNLYMVGDTREILSTLDTTTGKGTRVGTTSSGFGVNETQPTGLTSDGTNLYMIGQSQNSVYTLDTTTGEATNVLRLTEPQGVFRFRPNGIAYHSGAFYFVDHRGSALWTFDLTNTTPTRVGNITRFGVNELNPSGLASNGTNLYMLGGLKLYRFVDSDTPPTKPADASGLTATRASNTSIKLSWSALSGVTNYQYRRRTKGASQWGMWVTLSGTATSTTVTGLLANTAYEFQVRGANNNVFGGESNTASASTAAPSPTTAVLTINFPTPFTAGQSNNIAITADKDVTGLDNADITVTGATEGTLVRNNARSYTLPVTVPSSRTDVNVIVRIRQNAVTQTNAAVSANADATADQTPEPTPTPTTNIEVQSWTIPRALVRTENPSVTVTFTHDVNTSSITSADFQTTNSNVTITNINASADVATLTLRIADNTQGICSIVVSHGSISSSETDIKAGPTVNSYSPSFEFSRVAAPVGTPLNVDRIDMPEGTLMAGDHRVDIKFNRPLVSPELLEKKNIQLDGIADAVVKTITVDGSDASLYNVVVTIPIGRSGDLNVSVIEG